MKKLFTFLTLVLSISIFSQTNLETKIKEIDNFYKTKSYGGGKSSIFYNKKEKIIDFGNN